MTNEESKNIPLFKPPSAIVYSRDFEPISHIPMNEQMYAYFIQYEVVRFPVHVPLAIPKEPEQLKAPDIQFAEISAMKVYSGDGVRLLLIARDEATALLMRNSFLPGQTKELNYIKNQAFYQGMQKAIRENKK